MPNLAWPPDVDIPDADGDQKRCAETLRKHGMLAVEAAPGTGKTYLGVYLAMCAYRLGWTSKRQPVLFLTFSKNARVQIEKEVKSFVEKGWLGRDESAAIKIANYHSFYLELLRCRAGLWNCKEPLKPATILEQRQRIEAVLAQHGMGETLDSRKVAQAQLAFALTRLDLPELMGPNDRLILDRATLQDLHRSASCSLRSGRPSYDDFAPLFLNLLEHCPELVQWLRLAYPLMILDEFQDTDGLQSRILAMLRPRRLVILFDRFQMIYGWRGSRDERIERLETELGVPASAKVELKTNHRSGAQVGFANFIQQLRNCELDGSLVDGPITAPWLCCRPVTAGVGQVPSENRCLAVLRKPGIVGDFETTAILTRGNYLAEHLYNHLRVKKEAWQAAYSCRWIGGDNNQDEIIRDHIYELRDTSDAHGLRRWIGGLVDGLLPSACRTISFASALACGSDKLLAGRSKGEFLKIRERLAAWWDTVRLDNLDEILHAIEEVEVLAKIVVGEAAKLDPDGLYYVRVLADAVRRISAGHQPQSWAGLCDRLEESIASCAFKRMRWHQRGLYVLTVHQSKGREFDHVIVPWLSGDGEPTGFRKAGVKRVFPKPYKFNDPEDRRLLYVALTRAKRKVTIVFPEEDPSPYLANWKLRG